MKFFKELKHIFNFGFFFFFENLKYFEGVVNERIQY